MASTHIHISDVRCNSSGWLVIRGRIMGFNKNRMQLIRTAVNPAKMQLFLIIMRRPEGFRLPTICPVRASVACAKPSRLKAMKPNKTSIICILASSTSPIRAAWEISRASTAQISKVRKDRFLAIAISFDHSALSFNCSRDTDFILCIIG